MPDSISDAVVKAVIEEPSRERDRDVRLYSVILGLVGQYLDQVVLVDIHVVFPEFAENPLDPFHLAEGIACRHAY